MTIFKPHQRELQLDMESVSLLLPVVRKERLPTNTTTRKHATHRWFNFIAGFSPEFVSECIDAIPKARRKLLLDPFTGCATAQVEGIRNGMDVIGYEPHPVFVRIARAKISCLKDLNRIGRIADVIRGGLESPCDPLTLGESPEAFLTKLFDRSVLASLIGSRNAILGSEFRDDDLAFLVLSKVLDQTSHSQTDGIYKAPTSRKRARDPVIALDSIVSMIREDLAIASRSDNRDTQAKIYPRSCEAMPEVQSGSVDLIVTSPPYLNNFDFAEMTRMLLYFWSMASSWGEITDQVRSKLIVNTTTALKGHKDKQAAYREEIPKSLHPEIDVLVGKLKTMRSLKAGKKEYDLLVYPYFAQMSRMLRESLRAMRRGANFHMMVADSALYGVHIPTPQIIVQIMDEVGFQSVQPNLVRTRGERWILDKRDGSASGLGEYHISSESQI